MRQRTFSIRAVAGFVTAVSLAACSAGIAQETEKTKDGKPSLDSFTTRDKDSDGSLTEEEFVAGGGAKKVTLRRYFVVFDDDDNDRLSESEYLAIPAFTSPEDRQGLPDPVRELAKAALSNLIASWESWDVDGNESLSSSEFTKASALRQVEWWSETSFTDWDRDHDGGVTKEDIAQIVDVAFGVRSPTGEFLRSEIGCVVDWRSFNRFKPDGNGKVKRETYVKSLGDKAEKMFPYISDASIESFGVTEFMKSSHLIDPVRHFLTLDKDLNGVLSPAELEALPRWGPPGRNWLVGFDDDGDGAYSLKEFRLTPLVNLLATWQGARDSDRDGRLSSKEFRFMPGPSLAALAAEYFRRLDLDNDGYLQLNEWQFETKHPDAKFLTLDSNRDGELTESEFIVEGSLPTERLKRDFRVFDDNADERISQIEFRRIPHWVAVEFQEPVSDPVVEMSQTVLASLKQQWPQWDDDGDSFLAPGEFTSATAFRDIAGLEMTGFADWDVDQDGKLSQEEAALFLDVEFGIRIATGERLRHKNGNVLDWSFFKNIDPDNNGEVTRGEYLHRLQKHSDADKRFRTIAGEGSDSFSVSDYLGGPLHQTGPVPHFLTLDKDLDGRINPEEFRGIKWGPPDKRWKQGFDDDNDGSYSLREFLLIPHINVVAPWHTARDENNDGMLSPQEFQSVGASTFRALSAEYFRRLDLDHDGNLQLEEWPFSINLKRVPRQIVVKLRDRNGDGKLTFDEILGDVKRPEPGDRVDVRQEAALARREEAFLAADVNDDRILDQQEILTDAGHEAMVPGATGLADRARRATAPATKMLGMEETSLATYLIIEVNILLVIATAVYLYRKRNRKA
ncbi:MAG: hypothetical protein R3C59_28760 [Planctomycetaceae bacterium]